MQAAAERAGVPFRVGGTETLLDDGRRVFYRGVTVMGAPIGEEGYEAAVYTAKATASVSIIDETTRLLRYVSPLALRAP